MLSFNYEFIKDNFWWRRWKYSILVDLFDQINLHCEQMLPEILFRNGINNISNMYCENVFFSIVKRFCYYISRNKMANFGQKWLFAIFVVFAFVTHHHKRLWQAKARITSFLQAKVYLTLSLSVPLISNPPLSRFLSVCLFLYLCFYLVL